MSEPMVIRFQAMALDTHILTSDLLRMAKAIAAKLALQDVSEWIDCELNGYPSAQVPEYRMIRGQLRAFNPMRGLMEAPVANRELESKLSTVCLRNALSELESVPKGDYSQFHLPTQLAHALQASQPEFLRFSLLRVVGNHALLNIAQQVRNRLLDWSLKLEQQGILGENLQFSQKDKDRASMTTTNFNFHGTVNNAGVMGADNHDFTQYNTQQIAAGDFASLKQLLETLGISGADVHELKTALDSETSPAEPGRYGPKVSAWIGKISGMAAQGLLNAGIDKTAPLIMEAIARYIGS